MMDFLVKLAGVFGFILAVISLLWQIWAYCLSRKENIRGRLSVGGRVLDLKSDFTVFGLFFDVWNHGSIPVYIKSVGLGWGEESAGIGASATELLFYSYPKNDNFLKPGESRLFVLPISKENSLIKEAAKQPEDKIWVSVKSAKGEVLRIKGRQVIPLLK
jgi:hypothetical protein